MSIFENSSKQVGKAVDAGDRFLFVGAAIGLGVSVFNYFQPHNGIDHSWGALLVVLSSVVIVLASLVLSLATGMASPVRLLLSLAILLALLGTATAAYFLESDWLIAAMVLGLAGLILRTFFAPWWPERPSRSKDRSFAR